MAYAFSRIRDALGNESEQKANIFSPTGTDQGMEQAAQMGGPGKDQTKTSTEGVVSGGGSGGQASGTGEQTQPDQIQQQQGVRQAIQRNIGKTQNPKLISKAQGEVQSAEQGLQDEANAYVQNAKGTNYGVKGEDLDRFVAGDKAGDDAVYGLLNHAPTQADQFKTKQDLNLTDIDRLQSDAGVMQALRGEGGENYSAGMGAFDLAALRRTPGFDQIRQSLAAQKTALQGKAAGYEKSKTDEANAALKANLESAQGDLKKGLDQRSADLLAANQQEADEANASIQAGQGAYTADQQKAAIDALLKEQGGNRLDSYISGASVDPSQFYKGSNASAQDMIDAGEAAKFNRIMAALGKGDVYQAGGGMPKASFDADAFKNAVYGEATGKRQARDTELQGQIDNYLKGIQGRIDPAAEKAAEMAAVNAELSPQYKDVFGQVSLDPTKFMTGANDWHNYVTDADVSAMNPYFQELGQQNTFAPGQVGAGTFDQDSYKAALLQALAQKRQSIADKAAADKAAAKAAQQHKDMQGAGLENKGGAPTLGTSKDLYGGLGSLVNKAPNAAGAPTPHVNSKAPAIPVLPTKKSAEDDLKKVGNVLKKGKFY